MKWTPKHDLELVKEMLAERPFDYPKGSREIGAVWKKIMSNLNSKTEINFTLNTIRAVRDRYQLLETKFKRNMQKELNASGVAVEPTEFDEAMEDLVEYFFKTRKPLQRLRKKRSWKIWKTKSRRLKTYV